MYEEQRPKLPTNVKQIGNISQGIKIYVEDYVYTYIQQYASFAECEEKIGVLTGRKTSYENGDVLFINGIIQGKFSESDAGMEVLTEKSRSYIDEQIMLYFPNDEILGWVYIQPGYGDFLNTNLINYHESNFKKYYNVLFLFDPLEKVNGFFCKNEVTGKLEEVRGYFIYYDRNEGMHEYMLKNRLSKPKEAENLAVDEPDFDENAHFKGGGDLVTEKIRKSFDKERQHMPRTVRQKGKVVTEQRKLVNFLGTLSAVLFCACFVMGAGIIKNDDRINNVEKQMAAIDNSYTYIIKAMKEGNVQNVFAAQNGESGLFETTKPENEILTSFEQTSFAKESETEAISEKVSETVSEKPTTTTTLQLTEGEQREVSQKATWATSIVPQKYKVQEGDSLSSISIKFYGTKAKMKDIMAKNNLENPDMIYYGKIIYLP